MALTLKDNNIGILAYTVYVDDEALATVDEDDPVEYLHGGSNIVVGLEEALAGMQAGDSFDVTVPPEKGYGEYDEDNLIELDREEFEFDERDETLEIGMEVEMLDEEGNLLEGVIDAIEDDVVVVDLNPPLAGKTVRYAGEVIDVREATDEEIEWGFPESLLDEMFGEEDEFYEDE